MRLVLTIALRELRHEWLASLCFVAALVGGLAPLLVILALKNGVIDSMVDRLVEDPANREVIAIGAGRHGPAFFEMLATRSDVAFVIPSTRTINAQANAVRNVNSRRIEQAVPLIPSGTGDPLLAGDVGFVSAGRVVVSAELATALEVSSGSKVEMLIGREIDGMRETARVEFEVIDVLSPERYGRMAMFLSLPDLLATERFRDDRTIQTSDWTDPRPEPEYYASFRLYAARLADIAPLSAELRAMGVDTRPRAQNATLLLGFRKNLTFLYAVIAALAVTGFWAAMAANLRGMVARQRLALSLLALIGMRDRDRRMVPLVQAVVLVLTGIVTTLLLVSGMVLAVNHIFQASTGETVAQLGLHDLAATLCIGMITAVTSAVWAMRAIDGIGPDDVLREG
jgi:putative ABC transport system permease protein